MGEADDILARFGRKACHRKRSPLNVGWTGPDLHWGIARGERNVALRNIELIARTLGITLSELMKSV